MWIIDGIVTTHAHFNLNLAAQVCGTVEDFSVCGTGEEDEIMLRIVVHGTGVGIIARELVLVLDLRLRLRRRRQRVDASRLETKRLEIALSLRLVTHDGMDGAGRF